MDVNKHHSNPVSIRLNSVASMWVEMTWLQMLTAVQSAAESEESIVLKRESNASKRSVHHTNQHRLRLSHFSLCGESHLKCLGIQIN